MTSLTHRDSAASALFMVREAGGQMCMPTAYTDTMNKTEVVFKKDGQIWGWLAAVSGTKN